MTANVAQHLQHSGLDKYVDHFRTVSSEQFANFTIADISKRGVTDYDDIRKLVRLMQQLRQQQQQQQQQMLPLSQQARKPAAPAAPAAPRINAQQLDIGGDEFLIDLDAHDAPNLDLLAHACGPALALSPMGNERKQTPSNGAAAAAPVAAQAPSQPTAVPAAVPAASGPTPPGLPVQPDPPKIRVVVRKRPMNKKEREKQEEDIVDVDIARGSIVVNETKLKVDLTKYMERHQFNFDEALDESVSNDQVYSTTVQPLVQTLFKNGRASCFAYGQTGSGKTYTMSPLPIRAAADIMQYLAMEQYLDVTLHVSCFEIYGGKVFDLLNARKKLNILEDGKKQVQVVGLKEVAVGSVDAIRQLIEESNKQRSVGSTAANADSSRSHSIMQFALKRGVGAVPPPRFKGVDDGSWEDGKVIGKISFIDLAGSERGADTYDNNRQTRLEGADINKSLLALKECIRALDSDARHVPFRGSKLTAVLRDSFLGDQARTVMIANISPNSLSVEHTLNTLRYADRVKELRKDKADRTPGGVTPGDDAAYYAAVQRAVHTEPDGSAAAPPPGGAPGAAAPAAAANGGGQQQQGGGGGRPAIQPADQALNRFGSGAVRQRSSPIDDDDDMDPLVTQRNDLVSHILDEESVLLDAHRQHIEELMRVLQMDMLTAADVEYGGYPIDDYIDKLYEYIDLKADMLNRLRVKVDRFKEQLNQEEILSRSIPPRNNRKPRYQQ